MVLCVYISMSVIYVNLRGQELLHKDKNVCVCVCLQIGLGEAIILAFRNLTQFRH